MEKENSETRALISFIDSDSKDYSGSLLVSVHKRNKEIKTKVKKILSKLDNYKSLTVHSYTSMGLLICSTMAYGHGKKIYKIDLCSDGYSYKINDKHYHGIEDGWDTL